MSESSEGGSTEAAKKAEKSREGSTMWCRTLLMLVMLGEVPSFSSVGEKDAKVAMSDGFCNPTSKFIYLPTPATTENFNYLFGDQKELQFSGSSNRSPRCQKNSLPCRFRALPTSTQFRRTARFTPRSSRSPQTFPPRIPSVRRRRKRISRSEL